MVALVLMVVTANSCPDRCTKKVTAPPPDDATLSVEPTPTPVAPSAGAISAGGAGRPSVALSPPASPVFQAIDAPPVPEE